MHGFLFLYRYSYFYIFDVKHDINIVLQKTKMITAIYIENIKNINNIGNNNINRINNKLLLKKKTELQRKHNVLIIRLHHRQNLKIIMIIITRHLQ
jgi:hypothetical protein